MRIAFLSNYYPPFARGGYEQWCEEVAVQLARRGHQVGVLTSRPAAAAEVRDDGVEVRRALHLEVETGLAGTAVRLLRDRRRLERENLGCVLRLVADQRPDVALLWGMWNVPRAVPALVEQLLPGRVAYYLCDYWLSLPSAYVQQWQNPSGHALARLPKKVIGRAFLPRLLREQPVRLRLEHPICVSRAVREILIRDGVPIHHARTIQGGIQVDDFKPLALARWERPEADLKLLYAGRLAPEKGVLTAIRALAEVTGRAGRPVTLDLVGAGEEHYVSQIKALVRQSRLSDRVTFRGSVSRSDMPRMLAAYDALLFPSEWEEPFGRIVMEAMAVGLVVIGTTTGGTGDVLVEGRTGLTFPPGDPGALAAQIQRLRDDRRLGRELAVAGCRCVRGNFTFMRMVDEIEAYLRAMAAESRT